LCACVTGRDYDARHEEKGCPRGLTEPEVNRLPQKESHSRRWTRTGRLFDILNLPAAALGVLIVVVVVNVFLYFGYSAKTRTPPPAGLSTTIETPELTGPEEGTLPEMTRPQTTPQSTIPTDQSPPASATASATSSP
jgi:hypothetical protein